MFIIKPITPDNVKTIEKMISDDLLGITSLPRNKRYLHQKLNASLSAFSKDITAPKNEHYYFVLENIETGELGGICGIESRIGADMPAFTFCIEKIPAPETDLPVPRKQLVLHRQSITNGPSEICSLYIFPSFRKEGLGRLLSLSRFLFIACFPERFEEKIVAEMRGFLDEKNKSPFWEGLGKHFLNIEFKELMNLLEEIKDTIPLVTPKYPIYTSLLHEETQEAIGRVHLDTQPALNLLMQEGFTLTNEIDLFDGGPKIEAPTQEIRTVKYSRTAIVEKITSSPLESEKYMICNNKLDFRACYGRLALNGEEAATISHEAANALEVAVGEKIRFAAASNKHLTMEGS